MKELIDAIKSYSISDIAIILFAGYCCFTFIKGKIKESKKEKKEELQNYHQEQNRIEEHDHTINDRLSRLEEYVSNDREQIRGLGKHLDDIEETNNIQNKTLLDLSNAVRDLRIQSIRSQILDFYDAAIDLQSHRPAKEAYEECMRNYETYEALMHEKEESNGYLDYTYSKIIESMEQREKYHLFAENFFIPGKPMKDQLPKEKEIIEGFSIK